jgi:multidrug efflux pump subunit AcrB
MHGTWRGPTARCAPPLVGRRSSPRCCSAVDADPAVHPGTFIPTSDLGRSNLVLELPPGTRLQDTVALAEQARAKLPASGAQHVYSTIGGTLDIGDPTKTGVGEARKATLVLDWGVPTDASAPEGTRARCARALADLPARAISYISTEPGELMQLVLAATIRSADGSRAGARARPAHDPGPGQRSSSASLLRPELVIVPDPARAADLGVATADIAEAARIATTGDYRQRLAKLNLAERQMPIRVGFARSALDDPALLSTLRVPGNGGPVPLSAVARIEHAAARRRSTATSASATSPSPPNSTAGRWAR